VTNGTNGTNGTTAVLTARALRHAWGAHPALVDVHLDLHAGRITGFLGRNGAGKSTTLRILAGVVVPAGGTVRVQGLAAHDARARRRVGWAPEEPAVSGGLTVREQLAFAARLRGLADAEARNEIAQVIDSLDLRSVESKLCMALSRGTRQRVGTAMAFLGRPAVLLLDEPTAGLDPAQVAGLRTSLVARRAEGAAILLSSHVTAELEGLVDDVVVLARGRTVHVSGRDRFAQAVAAVAADGAGAGAGAADPARQTSPPADA
jgi:ABC-2 type transport system ATP-binding protein